MSCCVTAALAVTEKIFLEIKDHPIIKDCTHKVTTYPGYIEPTGENVVRIDWDFVNHWYDGGRSLFAKVRRIAKNDGYAMAYVDEYDHSFCKYAGDAFDDFFMVRKHIETGAWAAKRVDGFAPSAV